VKRFAKERDLFKVQEENVSLIVCTIIYIDKLHQTWNMYRL